MSETEKPLELFKFNGSARTRQAAIDEVADLLIDAGAVEPDYKAAMHLRDETASTYLGNFLALPHGTKESLKFVNKPAIALVSYDEPIEWHGNQVHFVIGLAANSGEHLPVISRIAQLFADENAIANLRNATSVQELRQLFSQSSS